MSSATEKAYAEAFFSLALEEECEKEFLEDMQLIGEVLELYPSYCELLEAPDVGKKEKRELLLQAFEGSIKDSTCDFLCLLSEKGRLRGFSTIANYYRELYNKKNNLIEVTVTTAFPLDPDFRRRILNKVKSLVNKEVILCEKVDGSLIGGIIVDFDGSQINVSVKKRLEDLKLSMRSAVS